MNNFTKQQLENNEAKQRLNNEFLKLNGSKNTEDTVGFFTKHNKVFQVLSVIFSAVGVYFDLLGLMGVSAVIVGVAVGWFIEFGKHRLSKGLFNGSLDDVSRWGLVGGTLFILMLIALLLHIRSINNFVGLNFQNKTNVLYQDELELTKATTSINLELAKALNNGTSQDDIISAQSIKSNNQNLLKLRESKTKNALLRSYENNKNTLKGILYTLFMSVEFFSLFGIFGMLIIQRNTDKNVKSVVTTADKLANLEANVYQAVETKMINQTLENVKQVVGDINHSPTPTDGEQKNEQNQPKVPQIGLNGLNNYKMPTNVYLMGISNRLNAESTEPKFLPTINKRKPTISGTRTETPNHLKENLKECEEVEQKTTENEEIQEEKEPKKVVDLLKFSHKEGEFLKLLWDNGEVKEGDKLIPKRFVLEQSAKGRETERELVNLYAKLEDQGLIMFKNGYRALADIENVTTVKRG